MIIQRKLLSWLFAFSLLALAVSAPAATPRSLVATVQRVSDGDSIAAISDNGTKLRIRLLGIDAPRSPTTASPATPAVTRRATTSTT